MSNSWLPNLRRDEFSFSRRLRVRFVVRHDGRCQTVIIGQRSFRKFFISVIGTSDVKCLDYKQDAGGSSASKAAPCGQSNSQSNGGRLMGGQPTLPNEFPWQVYIEPGFVWSSVDPACPVSFSMFWETSGVLLNDQWILTGARAMQWPGVIDPVVCNNVTFGEPIPYP